MTNLQDTILIYTTDAQLSVILGRLMRSGGFSANTVATAEAALEQAAQPGTALILIADLAGNSAGFDLAEKLVERFPAIPMLWFAQQEKPELLRRALQVGVVDVITLPLRSEEVLNAVRRALHTTRRRRESLMHEARRYTANLQRQMEEMETLTRLGRQITSSLSVDSVLTAIVDAAVEVTGAEEGSLLLIDETTGDLYIRASRNFQEDFVRTFRLPVTDSLAGSVIRSGEAVLLDESTPQKIKTAYLVKSLLYVPLQMHGHVFGVLGVDNRNNNLPLTQRHVKLMNMLAGYAVIALENARLYAEVYAGRNKLETILTGIQDGVIVVDLGMRVQLSNKTALEIFGLDPQGNFTDRPVVEVFNHPDLLALFEPAEMDGPERAEVHIDESRVLSAQRSEIAGIGWVVTLNDITDLKKLDRIKTEFVHTVSHDLRSPLTAILGYVDLIERAGAVNDLQRDFIQRVQASAQNITRLVDELLDLGRIESGFDTQREATRIDQLIQNTVDHRRSQIAEKGQHLQLNIPANLPPVVVSPPHIRQMFDHLVDNAIKYTPYGGNISVIGREAQSQVILQFVDTGIGIPASDQPYIFDKFYRAGNAAQDLSGTGLGLAIVKSIVENHGGRIWVDSMIGKGSTFTVVLPLLQSQS